MSYTATALGFNGMLDCASCGGGLGAIPVSAFTTYWVGPGSWQRNAGGNDVRGYVATKQQAGGSKRMDQWVAEQCVAGKLVYLTAPYGAQQKVDVYAGTAPLPAGFSSWPGSPPLEQYVCPGGGVATPPPTTIPGADEQLLASACLAAIVQKKDIALDKPAIDPVTGKPVIKVKYVAGGQGDCAFEYASERGGIPWVTIAVVGVAGVTAYALTRRRGLKGLLGW